MHYSPSLLTKNLVSFLEKYVKSNVLPADPPGAGWAWPSPTPVSSPPTWTPSRWTSCHVSPPVVMTTVVTMATPVVTMEMRVFTREDRRNMIIILVVAAKPKQNLDTVPAWEVGDFRLLLQHR